MEKYFKTLEDNEVQSQAIFLDPRFMKHGFSSNDKFELCKSYLVRKLQNLNVQIPNDIIEDETSTSSITQVSSSIWKNFDEQVSSVLGQNNPSVASTVEIDKYLN